MSGRQEGRQRAVERADRERGRALRYGMPVARLQAGGQAGVRACGRAGRQASSTSNFVGPAPLLWLPAADFAQPPAGAQTGSAWAPADQRAAADKLTAPPSPPVDAQQQPIRATDASSHLRHSASKSSLRWSEPKASSWVSSKAGNTIPSCGCGWLGGADTLVF